MNYLTILSALLSISSLAAQSLDIPIISVTETETTFVAVDEIHFTLGIKTYDKEIDIARNKNKEISKAVFDFLEKKKIPKQYIQTKRMNISRNRIRNTAQYDGFNAYQKIYVCLKDMNSYDEIADALLQMDVSSIDGPNFKSSQFEVALKEAKLRALKKARQSAEEMAAALGQKIGSAKMISSGGGIQNSNSGYSTPSSAANLQGGSSFRVGELPVLATVNVSFHLLE